MAAPVVHPPCGVFAIADALLAVIDREPLLRKALDAYPGDENMRVRWFSRLRGFEVTLRFDGDQLDYYVRNVALPRGEVQP